MDKLFTMILLVIGIEFCLVLYSTTNVEHTTAWDFVTAIDQWNSTHFFLIFGGIALALTLGGISAGSSFKMVTDFTSLATVIVGIMSMGVIFISLANAIRSNLCSTFFNSCGPVVGGVAQGMAGANLFTAILVGPIALYFCWCVFNWWRTPVG